MKDIKLVICDIDDTLAHKEEDLADSTIEMIRKLREMQIGFTMATGRMPYRAMKFIRETGLTLPMIANNGSILYDRGDFLFCKKVYAGQFKNIFREYMMKNPEFTVIFSYSGCERPVKRTNWIRQRLHKYPGYDDTMGDTDQVWEQEVHKVYILDDARTGIIGEIAARLRQLKGDFTFFQYGQYSMEIVGGGCTKASGLKRLLDYMHLAPEQVMAIGDHSNDMEVIRMAGLGVAVANAQEELKQIADYVSASERAAGVEEAVRKFIFESGVEKDAPCGKE